MKKPNLIYILADDMGYGDVSCLNENCAFQTPNLDKLANEGISFTNAHASSAVCTPSRYSIITGRYNWRSVRKRGVGGGYAPALIEEGRKTIADVLKDADYYTACVGKWHLGMDWAYLDDPDRPDEVDFTKRISNAPVDNGFDYYYGISASLDMPPYVYIENDRVTELPTIWDEGVEVPKPGCLSPQFHRAGWRAPSFKHEDTMDVLTDKALDVIEENRDKPFFLYFPLPAPHTPILPTEKFLGMSNTNIYGDYCLMCDDVVRQVMDKVKELGIDDNTIIVYTSDNGCSPQADFSALAKFGHNPSYHFRGRKTDIWEGGHRIPLLVRWPEGIEKGVITDQCVCLTDILATMADILDINIDEKCGVDSFSNLPLWRGEDVPVREFTIHQSTNGSLAIRKGKYKLEMCPGSGGQSFPSPFRDSTEGMPDIQLYDLDADIGETTNICEENPDIVDELAAILAKAVFDGRTTEGPKQKNDGQPIWEAVQWLKKYV